MVILVPSGLNARDASLYGIGKVRPDRSKYRVAGAGRPVNIEAEIHESLDDRGYLRLGRILFHYDDHFPDLVSC